MDAINHLLAGINRSVLGCQDGHIVVALYKEPCIGGDNVTSSGKMRQVSRDDVPNVQLHPIIPSKLLREGWPDVVRNALWYDSRNRLKALANLDVKMRGW